MITPSFLLAREFSPFEQLLKETFPTVRHKKKGSVIIEMSDDRSTYCYYILKGTCSFVMRHENGGVKVASLRGPGAIFPLFYTYKNTTMESPQEVIALSDMDLLVIPKPELHKLMLSHPELAIAMCDAHGKYETLLLYTISSQLFDPASMKIASYLFIQHNSYGNILESTHEEIGTATGVTRETVSRVLNQLKKQGIIKTERNKIKILSLQKLVNCCSYMTYSDKEEH